MGIIDADAHVLETPATWQYLDEAARHFTPKIMTQTSGAEALSNEGKVRTEYWMIGNRSHAKDKNVGSDTPKESREMADIGARLAHMDELGIETQVLYPSLFLRPVAAEADLELALCKSYNRWLAEIWKHAKSRLRWVAVPPLRSMDKVRDEMKFAKDNGACGIFLRGLECEKAVADPYFFPLYEIASELDLAIGMHSGTNSFTVHDFFEADTDFTKFKLAVVGAFHSLLDKEVPARFPDVRWGFVEVRAQWVPYILIDIAARMARRGKPWPDNPMAEFNMYVACEVTDDIGYIVRHAGEDNIVIGTDYGHHDPSAEINALRLIRQNPDIEAHVADKILDANPRALYGL